MKIYWFLILTIATIMVAAIKIPSPKSVGKALYKYSDAILFLKRQVPYLDKIDLLDGPYNISNARIKPKIPKKELPAMEVIDYYGNFATAAYCTEDVKNLDGPRIAKFKSDIVKIADYRDALLRCTGFVTLSETREELVMAFRGTSNIRNAALDGFAINLKTRSKKEVRIHRGFYLAAMSLYEQMVTAVGYLRSLKEEYQNYKIVLVGHSMGGAIARITQYYLHHLDQFPGVNIDIYTFGEPRTGNKPYVDYLNTRPGTSVRVVNKGDPVSHVPPTNLLSRINKIFGDAYLHCLTEFWIDRHGGQRYCKQSVYEDRSCSMSLTPFYKPSEHSEYFDSDAKCAHKPEKPLSKSSWAKNIAKLIKRMPHSPTKITDFSAAADFIRDV